MLSLSEGKFSVVRYSGVQQFHKTVRQGKVEVHKFDVYEQWSILKKGW